MAKKETKKPFVMNLQLFADTEPTPQPSQADLAAQAMQILQGGVQPTEGAAPIQGQPIPTEGNPQPNPQQSGEPGQQPNQEPTQGQPQPAPNSADQLLLGKFKSPEELASGYVNVERAFSQKSQEAAALQQQNAALQQQMQQIQQQIQSVVNPQQQQPQPTPEEQTEQFMSQFYENPMEAIKGIIEQAVMPKIQPIEQQYQAQQKQAAWDSAVGQFAQQTPDFNNFKDAMAQVLQQNPELNNHPNPIQALSIAYNVARGQNYQEPSQLLQNQDFVKQNILSNEDIKNQVIQEYLQGLQKGNQAPTVISGQPGGQTTVVPENQPQTIKDARSLAERYFK